MSTPSTTINSLLQHIISDVKKGEPDTKGDCSQLENILFTKILNYLQLKEENVTSDNVHRVYLEIIKSADCELDIRACHQ